MAKNKGKKARSASRMALKMEQRRSLKRESPYRTTITPPIHAFIHTLAKILAAVHIRSTGPSGGVVAAGVGNAAQILSVK